MLERIAIRGPPRDLARRSGADAEAASRPDRRRHARRLRRHPPGVFRQRRVGRVSRLPDQDRRAVRPGRSGPTRCTTRSSAATASPVTSSSCCSTPTSSSGCRAAAVRSGCTSSSATASSRRSPRPTSRPTPHGSAPPSSRDRPSSRPGPRPPTPTRSPSATSARGGTSARDKRRDGGSHLAGREPPAPPGPADRGRGRPRHPLARRAR